MLHFVGVFALVFAGMILFGGLIYGLISVTWWVADAVAERFGHPFFGVLCWLFWLALVAAIVITTIDKK